MSKMKFSEKLEDLCDELNFGNAQEQLVQTELQSVLEGNSPPPEMRRDTLSRLKRLESAARQTLMRLKGL